MTFGQEQAVFPLEFPDELIESGVITFKLFEIANLTPKLPNDGVFFLALLLCAPMSLGGWLVIFEISTVHNG